MYLVINIPFHITIEYFFKRLFLTQEKNLNDKFDFDQLLITNFKKYNQ